MRNATVLLLCCILMPALLANAVVWKDAEQGGCIVKVGVQSMGNPTTTCFNVVGGYRTVNYNGQNETWGWLEFQVILDVIPQTRHQQNQVYHVDMKLYDDTVPTPILMCSGSFDSASLGDATWCSGTQAVTWRNIPNTTRQVGSLELTVTPRGCECPAMSDSWPVVFVQGGARTVSISLTPDPVPAEDTLDVTVTWTTWEWGTEVNNNWHLEPVNNSPFLQIEDPTNWPSSPTEWSYEYDGGAAGSQYKVVGSVWDNCGSVYAESNTVTMQ